MAQESPTANIAVVSALAFSTLLSTTAFANDTSTSVNDTAKTIETVVALSDQQQHECTADGRPLYKINPGNIEVCAHYKTRRWIQIFNGKYLMTIIPDDVDINQQNCVNDGGVPFVAVTNEEKLHVCSGPSGNQRWTPINHGGYDVYTAPTVSDDISHSVG